MDTKVFGPKIVQFDIVTQPYLFWSVCILPSFKCI